MNSSEIPNSCANCDFFKRCEGFNIKGICENPEVMRRFTQSDYICEKDENAQS